MNANRDFKPRETKVFKIKMSAPVAAYTINKATVGLKMPLVYPVGSRLWMVEWAGAPTGRADLCTVVGVYNNLLYFDRRMCWHQGKFDDNLSEVSLTVTDDQVPMIDRSVIPEEKEQTNG
jgi:hypothetical protein